MIFIFFKHDDLVKSQNSMQRKKLQIQGAQIQRNEAYLQYAAVTMGAAQRRSWTFYEAIKHGKSITVIALIKAKKSLSVKKGI